jgi:hypothetical protein
MKSSKQSSASSSSARTSRRRFTKAVATTIVAAPLASRLTEAERQGATKEQAARPDTQSATQAQKRAQVAEAYLAVVRARFGDQLTPAQFEQVKKDLEANLQAAERLRAVKLKNEDEPDVVFSAE